ncbi:unnamed protein product [Somion occarium]|uniref:Uncharacterized protein n=1 Tax=Somion occarium TaxID=3059160 RepID=A0ABP1DU32_9APHY
MVNWKDPAVEKVCAIIYSRMSAVLLGVYLWYFCVTFKTVEGALILRKLRFSLTLIPYFLGRYSTAVSVISDENRPAGSPEDERQSTFGLRQVTVVLLQTHKENKYATDSCTLRST